MSFENAPVSKGLMMGCALTSIAVGLFDVKHYFHLQLVPHISRHHQYWRLFLHHLAFSSSSDLFVAELVLYNIAVQVERLFGSVKFASFALVSTLLSTILEFLSLLLFHRLGLNYISSGPSTLLFNILYQYSRIVPSVYDFRIFGVPLTNKSFVYVLAFQLAISRLPGSAAAALIGIIAGQLYRSDLANLKSYRLPPSLTRLSARFLLPLIGSARPARRPNTGLPDQDHTPPPLPQRANPQDESITTARAPPPLSSSSSSSSASASSAAPSATTSSPAGGRSGNNNNNLDDTSGTGTSVMREWVNELTGRTERGHGGIRVPAETEISTLVGMFPNLEREVVVAALQRSPNIEGAVETLLIP